MVKGPRLTRATSRRRAIARRRGRAVLFVMLQGKRFSRALCSRTSARVLVRGAARVIRQSLRMVSSQAERRNGSIHGPPCGNRLDARKASGKSHDTKLHVYSRRSTVPHFCVPPGDAPSRPVKRVCMALSFPRNFGTSRFVNSSILI